MPLWSSSVLLVRSKTEFSSNECFPVGPLATLLTGVLVSGWQPVSSSMLTFVRGRNKGYVRQTTKSKMADNHEKARMVKTPLKRIESSSNCIYLPSILRSLKGHSKPSKSSSGLAKTTEPQILPENRTKSGRGLLSFFPLPSVPLAL